MKFMMVTDGVNTLHGTGYGPIYWVNHLFLPSDAIIMSDNKISQSSLEHTALCGRYYGALNAKDISRPDCSICVKIAAGIVKGEIVHV